MHVDTTSEEYTHKVYAGVLGKMIGVYLGRPIEGMAYRDIRKQFGSIQYYVHEQRKRNLIVADDDLTGTFTFVRALEDHRSDAHALVPEQIGRTWLNYVIEDKTIFWWGGLGLSTEHTAFLRLKSGIPAPQSGSAALNSKVVAEQIGSQIFIDAWAMVVPGDPALAADLARKAASVSHDGEAIYGAQVIAAMESLAFVEADLNVLLDVAARLIPDDSVIYRMIAELRAFHVRHPDDWERAFVEVLEASYGYNKYGGNCHIVPNHGVVMLALLYARDNFHRAQMIANTCGWDTDCNAGNVGCLMGIKNGLAGIDAGPDWRGPVADRLLLPTADGGECITDAAREACRLIDIGRALQDKPPWTPKRGARFHFALPGSVQGFQEDPDPSSRGVIRLSNTNGCLAIHFDRLAPGRNGRVATPTFLPPGTSGGAYNLIACPTLWPGQTVRAAVRLSSNTGSAVAIGLFARRYGPADAVEIIRNTPVQVVVGQQALLEWIVPPGDDTPIFEIGLELIGDDGATGVVILDWLTWDGAPDVTLGVPNAPGEMARRQWIEALDGFHRFSNGSDPEPQLMATQNHGRGLAICGTRDWKDYTVSATLTPHLAQAAGLAARVRGLRQYYALLLRHPNRAALVKICDDEKVLAEAPFPWQWNDDPHALSLRVQGNRISGSIDDDPLFDVVDPTPILSGGIALVIEEGRLLPGGVRVRPLA